MSCAVRCALCAVRCPTRQPGRPPVNTGEDCCQKCAAQKGCAAFSYITASGACYLKSRANSGRNARLSGFVNASCSCTVRATACGAPSFPFPLHRQQATNHVAALPPGGSLAAAAPPPLSFSPLHTWGVVVHVLSTAHAVSYVGLPAGRHRRHPARWHRRAGTRRASGPRPPHPTPRHQARTRTRARARTAVSWGSTGASQTHQRPPSHSATQRKPSRSAWSGSCRHVDPSQSVPTAAAHTHTHTRARTCAACAPARGAWGVGDACYHH